jgi:hypothetical protein
MLAGARIWNRIRNNIIILITIPNNWSDTQKEFLRKVAVDAGLHSAENVTGNLIFVRDHDAVVNFALSSDDHHDALGAKSEGVKPETTLGIAIAGDASVDYSVYTCHSTEPLILDNQHTERYLKVG